MSSCDSVHPQGRQRNSEPSESTSRFDSIHPPNGQDGEGGLSPRPRSQSSSTSSRVRGENKFDSIHPPKRPDVEGGVSPRVRGENKFDSIHPPKRQDVEGGVSPRCASAVEAPQPRCGNPKQTPALATLSLQPPVPLPKQCAVAKNGASPRRVATQGAKASPRLQQRPRSSTFIGTRILQPGTVADESSAAPSGALIGQLALSSSSATPSREIAKGGSMYLHFKAGDEVELYSSPDRGWIHATIQPPGDAPKVSKALLLLSTVSKVERWVAYRLVDRSIRPCGIAKTQEPGGTKVGYYKEAWIPSSHEWVSCRIVDPGPRDGREPFPGSVVFELTEWGVRKWCAPKTFEQCLRDEGAGLASTPETLPKTPEINTRETDLAALGNLFNVMDIDGNGVITRDEVTSACIWFRDCENTEGVEDLKSFLRFCDENSDYRITRDEYDRRAAKWFEEHDVSLKQIALRLTAAVSADKLRSSKFKLLSQRVIAKLYDDVHSDADEEQKEGTDMRGTDRMLERGQLLEILIDDEWRPAKIVAVDQSRAYAYRLSVLPDGSTEAYVAIDVFKSRIKAPLWLKSDAPYRLICKDNEKVEKLITKIQAEADMRSRKVLEGSRYKATEKSLDGISGSGASAKPFSNTSNVASQTPNALEKSVSTVSNVTAQAPNLPEKSFYTVPNVTSHAPKAMEKSFSTVPNVTSQAPKAMEKSVSYISNVTSQAPEAGEKSFSSFSDVTSQAPKASKESSQAPNPREKSLSVVSNVNSQAPKSLEKFSTFSNVTSQAPEPPEKSLSTVSNVTSHAPNAMERVLFCNVTTHAAVSNIKSQFKEYLAGCQLFVDAALHAMGGKGVNDVTTPQILKLIKDALDIVRTEALVIRIETPPGVVVLGDLHGNFECLKKLLSLVDFPNTDRKLVFLGDYVDRGKDSVATIVYLLALKIKYPDRVFLLRGNHEDEAINAKYGFQNECVNIYGRKHGEANGMNIYRAINNFFTYLSLAVVVDNKLFCCHGGIGPASQSLQQLSQEIAEIKPFGINLRPTKDAHQIVLDLMWADPDRTDSDDMFTPNRVRNASFCWNEHATEEFLYQSGLELIVRGHEVFHAGFEYVHSRKVLTVFSSSGYSNGNHACVFLFEGDTENMKRWEVDATLKVVK